VLRCRSFCVAQATLKILYTKLRFDREDSITHMRLGRVFAKFYPATDRLQSGVVALNVPSINRLVIVAQDSITRGPRYRIDLGQQTSTNSLGFLDMHGGADHPVKNHQIAVL
jgi:hypothetical protein